MDQDTLYKVRDWAEARIASGEEPPWTYFKLEKLAELTRELGEGLEWTAALDPSKEKASGPGSDPARSADPGQGAEIVQIGIVRSRREEIDQLSLPT